jgi:hypothetical protein
MKISTILFFSITPILLWIMYVNIDHVAWVSWGTAEFAIGKDAGQTVMYKLTSFFAISATNRELLTTIRNFVNKYSLEFTFAINSVMIKFKDSGGDFDYGGLIMTPNLTVEYRQVNNPITYKSYFWTFLDTRKYCGDTPKSGFCKYNNPFKGFTFPAILGVYSFICVVMLYVQSKS